MMKLTSLQKLTLTALFIALTFTLTFFPSIEVGVGFIHLGDIPIYLSAMLIDPWTGALVGAIGGSLADLLKGYAVYIPFTIVAKVLEALLAGFVFQRFKRGALRYSGVVLGGIAMVLTYLPAYWIIDPTYLILGLTMDLIQSGLSVAIAIALAAILQGKILQVFRSQSHDD